MNSRKKLPSLWTISMSRRAALHFYSGKIVKLEHMKVIFHPSISVTEPQTVPMVMTRTQGCALQVHSLLLVFFSNIASLTSKAPPSGRNIQLPQVFARLTRSQLPRETVWSKGAEQPAASRGSRPGCYCSVRWDLFSCVACYLLITHQALSNI